MSDADKPTHLHVPSGAAVFPEGHRKRELVPLPSGYWDEVACREEIAAIKAKAAAEIESFAPLWKQLNALANRHAPESEQLLSRITMIRNRSNDEELNILGSYRRSNGEN
jgi:hypothetical protein